METTNTESRSGLKFKFALFYLISVGIIVYLFSLFLPGNTSAGMLSNARPVIATDDAGSANLVPSLEALNSRYKQLKELDQEYAQQATGGASAANELLASAENSVNKSLDSLAVTARSIEDRKLALQLQNFVDAYRFALSDRSAMRVYKIAALTPGKSNSNTNGQEALTQMQNEVVARDKRIAELQNQNYSLEQRVKTAASTGSATTASQQNTDALKATINDQEKRIASLTTANSALEKQNAVYSNAAVAKPAVDNGSAAMKSQNALLEKQVASLTAEVRLAQVDCSLSRADASQIISNSKQRKALLSDALVTLNGLAATSDPTIRKKVTDKMVKLNQVASNVHD